ncbi:DUF1062 domain-containing protein [Sphingobacterium sp.]|uniref:DUF1062 domain-containing protein n=1 Tax=Sphingobacterium sp. TaxID=341027 RepID=UPI00391758FA
MRLLFTPTRPTEIDSLLFNKFQNNDTELAWKYAFSEEIRTCLNLSSRQLDQLLRQEAITMAGKYLQKKHKAKNRDRIEIDCKKLKSIRCNKLQRIR